MKTTERITRLNNEMKDRRMNEEFPNTRTWNFAGELSADGTTITGVTSSIQGGMQVEFRKR